MYIINVRFEWDSKKVRTNAIKHGVGFKEAATAFHDTEAMLADDPDLSDKEDRELLIGESARGHLLVVAFTRRPGPSIRLISARFATVHERRRYEQNRGISI